MRIDPALWTELESWAQDEFRSVNGQIEYLLHQAVLKHRGGPSLKKTTPLCFRTVLSRLGVTSDPALMIGNNPTTDIKGAKALGMKAVWINRSGKPCDDSVQPDFIVSNLSELRKALNLGQIHAGRSEQE